MKFQAALVICALALQAVASKEACSGVFFDGKPHVEQLMKADVYKPSSLAVDHKAKALYFSYLQLGNIEYKTVKLDLGTKRIKRIDVDGGSSIAVDQKRHLAYIGGAKGLYKYHPSNKAKLVLPAVSIWKLYFSEVLYYIEFITQTVFKFVDGKSTPFEDLAGSKVYFLAKDDDYMVYSNGTGVYGKKVGSGDSTLIKEVQSVDEIREISIDRRGRFFVLSNDGIYKIDKVKQSLEKVADIREAYGMTFDAENQLIYSKETSVVRLVPNNDCEI